MHTPASAQALACNCILHLPVCAVPCSTELCFCVTARAPTSPHGIARQHAIWSQTAHPHLSVRRLCSAAHRPTQHRAHVMSFKCSTPPIRGPPTAPPPRQTQHRCAKASSCCRPPPPPFTHTNARVSNTSSNVTEAPLFCHQSHFSAILLALPLTLGRSSLASSRRRRAFSFDHLPSSQQRCPGYAVCCAAM